MGIRELRIQASQLKIVNYGKMNKAQLEAAINEKTASPEPVSLNYSAMTPESFGVLGMVSKGTTQASPEPVSFSMNPSKTSLNYSAMTPESFGVMLGMVGKGTARKLRRAANAAGYKALAATRRVPNAGVQSKAA